MNDKRKIPLADLAVQYQALKAEIDAAIAAVVGSTAFIRGGAVADFERAFATYCGVKSAVGTGNGTDAIYLALRALGVGPGDEVITVSHTFVGTVEGIVLTGARPVFVDVDEDALLMNPDLIEEAVTPNTRAIVPVHLYGQPCDMDRIMAVARRRGLKVVEDAAQAHGATWRGKPAGGLGDAGCFSFFPGKNLGAYGDGGAVTGDNTALIDDIRRTANHGRKDKYTHDVIGVNSRLDTIQAAILSVKLPHLAGWNEKRRAHARQYDRAFANSLTRPLKALAGAALVYHLYVVRVPETERDRVVARLNQQGIAASVHYPVPLHRQPALAGQRTAPGPLPVTERAAREVISLPVYPEMTADDVDFVADAVKAALAGAKG